MKAVVHKQELRILLVKLSAIGDCIYALPLVHALRRRFPKAFIAWVIDARASEVVQGQEGVDEMIVVDTRGWRRQLVSGQWGLMVRSIKEVFFRLRRQRFDIAIDAQGLIKSGALTWLSGAPLRIGFESSACREKLNTLFTNHRVRLPGDSISEGPVHVLEKNLLLLTPLGIEPARDHGETTDFHFTIRPDDDKRVADFLADSQISNGRALIGIHPGAGHPVKFWEEDRFSDLSDLLIERLGATVALFGGIDSADRIQSIRTRMNHSPLLVPRLTLKQLGAFFRRCQVVVSADSGPLHLAAAVGCANVGLFGPSDPRICGPRGQKSLAIKKPCSCEGPKGHFFNRRCWQPTCMKSIETEEVYQAVQKLLQ